ncbi:hypothetical protein Tcan_10247 [Toxocara canis]|uniref:Uncharacterized protein n=1 Tax=Toxocara canis TaxID=6265 RepID=A0A0B2UMY7_TOXCA|nr:hypothetical protein Tcan_10247 [Toxocara canis]
MLIELRTNTAFKKTDMAFLAIAVTSATLKSKMETTDKRQLLGSVRILVIEARLLLKPGPRRAAWLAVGPPTLGSRDRPFVMAPLFAAIWLFCHYRSRYSTTSSIQLRTGLCNRLLKASDRLQMWVSIRDLKAHGQH